jgi:rhombotail lipoprotein
MRADLEQAPLFESQTLAEVEGLEPELTTPFAVAVAPPRSHRSEQLAWQGSRETVQGFRSWSEEERRVIASWKEELARTGLVSDLIVMPVLATELDATGGLLEALRVAAARHQADAVLIVSEVEDSSNWLNPWSILDLTIVGAWFAPGHDVEVVTILEGALIDVHTGYLYASGQAEGTARERRAWAYVNDPELKQTARRKALAGLEQVILERADAAARGEPTIP